MDEQGKPTAKTPEELADLSDPHRWRTHWRKEAAPHAVLVKAIDGGANIAVQVSLRKKPYGNWSQSKNALKFMTDLERTGKMLRSYVVLLDNKRNLIACARASEVTERIGNTPPTPGYYDDGGYWWVDSSFTPSSFTSSSNKNYNNDDEDPFDV